jgi:hypothetical protein
MTLATAAAVAVASGVPLSVPLNDSNNIPNQSETAVSLFLLIKNKHNFFYSKGGNKSIIRRSCTSTTCNNM